MDEVASLKQELLALRESVDALTRCLQAVLPELSHTKTVRRLKEQDKKIENQASKGVDAFLRIMDDRGKE